MNTMADEGLMSQHHDDGSLWDELSHQHSREIQLHRNRVAAEHSTAQRVADTSAAALRTAAELSGAALSAAGAAAAAAASGAREGYRLVASEGRRRGRGVHAAPSLEPGSAGLSEFGLHSALSHPRGVGDGFGGDGGGVVGADDAAASLLANEYEGGALGGGVGEAGDNGGRLPDAASPENNNFVFLRNFRLRHRREGWGAVANLDLFFTSIYNYYYHGGMAPIVGTGMVELISLFFTLWLSVFLFAYLDWSALATCTDEATCHSDFRSYIIEKPFSKWNLWNFLVILYCLVFTCYGVVAVLSFVATVRDALDAKIFFEDKLGISARKLEGGAVEWDEIVQKIVRLQETGEHRVAIHGQDINALVIAQRILRKENFMVAFFNRNMLDLTIPVPLGWFSDKVFFSKSLEWSIYFTILSYMFNHKYQIRPSFYMDSSSLKRRLVLCGVTHAIFMPFLLFFMMLHFFMLNLYDWRSSKQYLGPREWTPVAKWTFREFNELPHAFERRIGPSYEAAEDYLKLFTQSAALTATARALAFVSGSLAAVLVAFAAVNDSILLHVKLGQWNLLWYVGILGIIFSFSRGVLPSSSKLHRPSTRNLFAEMDSALAKVATHTHFFPDVWKKRGWDKQTQTTFSGMFQYKAKLFAMEVLSVVLAPIILCISLPKCAPYICSFVQKVKMEVAGAGDVCGYSIFDFDAFEDESWEGRQMRPSDDPSASGLEGSGVPATPKRSHEMQMKLDARPKTRMGKMEKSFFSFKAVHPSWKCSASGQDLLDRVESYQNQQAIALARERRHHIEAAARQLETLRQIEQKRDMKVEPKVTLDDVNETYIARNRSVSGPDAGADSGGGGSIQESGDSRKGESNLDDTLGELRSYAPPHQSGPGPRVHFQQHRTLQQTDGQALSGIESAVESSSAMLPPQGPQGSAAASVLHYADTGLSTELQRVLNRSTLDPNLSVAGSVLGAAFGQSIPSLSHLEPLSTLHSSSLDGDGEDEDDALDRNAQRQYMWLERYHSAQQQQQQSIASISRAGSHAENWTQPDASGTGTQRAEDGAGQRNDGTDANSSSM